MVHERYTNRAVLAAPELFIPAVSYTDSLLFMDEFFQMFFSTIYIGLIQRQTARLHGLTVLSLKAAS